MNVPHRILTTTAFFALFAASVQAGDLNPPVGAIVPTMKPLSEIEPRTAISPINTPGDANTLFRITQPGSYYLTSNVTVPASRTGIRIASSNVTIDLNGFSLIGGGPSSGGISFADQAGGYVCTTVRNGCVRGMSAYGISLWSSMARGTVVENVIATNNAGDAIVASGGSVVRNCVAYGNSGTGISMSGAQPGVIENCVAFSNTSVGIYGSIAPVVRGCTAMLNGSDGISTGNGSLVTSCTAYDNSGNGILASQGSTVTGCTTSRNNGDGIEVNTRCRVSGNTCSEDGFGLSSAAIHVTGNNNSVESNFCVESNRGIVVDSGGNIVVRNTCSENGVNWLIAAGNAVAPIVQTSTNAALINGNTYAGSLGSADGNANFTN